MFCRVEILGLLLNSLSYFFGLKLEVVLFNEKGERESVQWIEGRVIGKCLKNYEKIPFIKSFICLFIADDNT